MTVHAAPPFSLQPVQRDREEESNPFYQRLSRIEHITIRINCLSSLYTPKFQKLQERVQRLSDQIQTPVYLPWLQLRADLKTAMRLMQQKFRELSARPSFLGAADEQMTAIEAIRDRILRQTTELNAAYDEIDELSSKHRREIEPLWTTRTSMIHDYAQFHDQNWERLSKDYSDEIRSKLQAKYDLFVAPYMEGAIKDTQQLLVDDVLHAMSQVMTLLDETLKLSDTIQTLTSELEEVDESDARKAVLSERIEQAKAGYKPLLVASAVNHQMKQLLATLSDDEYEQVAFLDMEIRAKIEELQSIPNV